MYKIMLFIAGVSVLVLSIFHFWPTEPITAPYTDEVHVHSDFMIHINGTELDLTDDRYQSDNITNIKHDYIHLHDNADEVVHRHAENITFLEFLDSLGIILTDTTLTLDTGETYTADESNELATYINGEVQDISTYINQEEDQIMIYYGPKNNSALELYLLEISDLSCLYSGTCPWRGEAPTESCGLTCDITSTPGY